MSMTDEEIRAVGAQVADAAKRLHSTIAPGSRSLYCGLTCDLGGAPFRRDESGRAFVTFTAAQGRGHGEYVWYLDEVLPLSACEIGAVLVGMVIGAERERDWFAPGGDNALPARMGLSSKQVPWVDELRYGDTVRMTAVANVICESRTEQCSAPELDEGTVVYLEIVGASRYKGEG